MENHLINKNIFKEYQGGIPEQAVGEELCTFNGFRLTTHRVWFAVKKEVGGNKFAIPKPTVHMRDDIYGTSVLSIQWSKGGIQTVSIKNRYNHNIVDKHSDATLFNTLHNIYMGLHEAFCSAFNIDMSIDQRNLEIDDFILANDGKFHLPICERNDLYFCDDNSIIFPNRNCKSYYGNDKSAFTVIDGYVIRKKKPFAIIDQLLEDKKSKQGFSGLEIELKSIKEVENKETKEEEKINKSVFVFSCFILPFPKAARQSREFLQLGEYIKGEARVFPPFQYFRQAYLHRYLCKYPNKFALK